MRSQSATWVGLALLAAACSSDPPDFQSGTDDEQPSTTDGHDGGGTDATDDSPGRTDDDEVTDDVETDDVETDGTTDDVETDDEATDDEATDDEATDDEATDGEVTDGEGNCGDGTSDDGESCDDGNTTAGDGCDASCEVEEGWTCTDDSSGCTEACGDGLIVGEEECDDAGSSASDGCSATCSVEDGWDCSGEPSTCVGICGDGQVDGSETCDDGNAVAGDGCSPGCESEPGWACDGEPSTCAATCGDGSLDAGEACDDGNAEGDDGCDDNCRIESGYACSGTPSSCHETCGNGDIDDGETCDDGDTVANDGCSPSCALESGWACDGTPSTCHPVCGDGQLAGAEQCDDANTAPNDGCTGSCALETDWTCTGEPSSCEADCGNAELDAGEDCDDGNSSATDGCHQCQIQSGWECSGQPSDCSELLPPVISAFSSSEDSLPGGGGETLLAWTVSGADVLRINAEGMNDLGVVTGSFIEVEVTADVTFTLVAENEAGTVQQSVSVELNSVGEVDLLSQFGTSASDAARDVAVAVDGSIIVVGDTFGDMDGSTRGGEDIFVRKYDASGEVEWTRQLGSAQTDEGYSVAVDSSGNVYVGGLTYGAIETGSSNSDPNCVFARYTAAGDFDWAHQLAGSGCYVAVGGSSLYVGYTSGASYIRKYGLDGTYSNTQCSHDFTQSSDGVRDIVADSSAAYFVGNSLDGMGGGPATLFGCSSSGTKLWDEEWHGGSYTYLSGAALADGTLYVSGSIYGGIDLFADSAGFTDAFVALHPTSTGQRSADGIQFGSAGYDTGRDVAVDSRGNVIVGGAADGSFQMGESGTLYVAKRSPTNASLWLHQFGPTDGNGLVNGVAVAPNGMVVAVGSTDSELAPNPPGGSDAFLIIFR